VGTLKPADTINVGYYSYHDYPDLPETAILTLEKYNGKTEIENYFIFPGYDAKKGIEPLNIAGKKSGKKEYDTIYKSDVSYVTGDTATKEILYTSVKFNPYIDFSDYQVSKVDNRKLAKLDLSSHENGRMYRTNLTEAYKDNEANF